VSPLYVTWVVRVADVRLWLRSLEEVDGKSREDSLNEVDLDPCRKSDEELGLTPLGLEPVTVLERLWPWRLMKFALSDP